jgi:hypothetical protein
VICGSELLKAGLASKADIKMYVRKEHKSKRKRCFIYIPPKNKHFYLYYTVLGKKKKLKIILCKSQRIFFILKGGVPL